jgi:YVTN family beta-propeller protein
MKSAILAVCCLAALGAAQVLESTIQLPDTFGGMEHPNRLLYNPGNNTVFVAGRWGRHVAVVDGVSGRRVAVVPVSGSADAMCYNSIENKVYCASHEVDSVYVVDAAAYRVIATLPVPVQPRTLCCNPTENKVYCGSYVEPAVTVIDGSADTVLATVTLWEGVRVLDCAPELNRIYCGLARSDTDAVAVLDGAGDTVVGSIRAVDIRLEDLLYNAVSRKVYFTDREFETVVIADAESGTVLEWLGVGEVPLWLELNPDDNKVYVTTRRSRTPEVDIVCGFGDTIIRRLDIGDWQVSAIAYDPDGRRVFCASGVGDSLIAIDGRGDTVVGSVHVGETPAALVYAQDRNRIYTANSASNDVTIVDAVGLGVVGTVPSFWTYPLAMCYESNADKVYITGSHSAEAVVVEASTNTTIGRVSLGEDPGPLLAVPELGKVYCGRRRYYNPSIWSFDSNSDSVIAEIPVTIGGHHLAFRPGPPGEAKVYCAGARSGTITVIDAYADTAVTSLYIGEGLVSLVYASGEDRVFCAQDDGGAVAVIDCSADTTIGTLNCDDPEIILYIQPHNYVCVADDNVGLEVYDAASLRRVATLSGGWDPNSLVYNSNDDKLYNLCGEELLYISDMYRLETVDSIWLDGPFSLLFDSLANKLYCMVNDTVKVFDGKSDSLVAEFVLAEDAYLAAWSPRWQRVFAGMGNSTVAVFHDTLPTGAGEGRPKKAVGANTPTFVGRHLQLLGKHGADLLDITGRRVMSLQPGRNDIRAISPGIYFIRRDEDNSTTKVVVQR